jgi:hypothetical protein
MKKLICICCAAFILAGGILQQDVFALAKRPKQMEPASAKPSRQENLNPPPSSRDMQVSTGQIPPIHEDE